MSDGKFHLRSIGWLPLLAALLFLSAGCTSPDKTVEKKFAEAQTHLDAGQPAEAIRILEELNQTYPERLDVVEFLAFTHASNNNPAQAAVYFTEANRLAPERDDLLLFAAQAFESANDLESAASQYRLYIVDNFDDASGWQALANVERRRGYHRDSIDAFLNVYRIRPDGDTATALGDLFLQLNNTAQAHHWFRTALEHPGESTPQALLGLLKISLEEENWDRAEELIADLDARFPGHLDKSELAAVRAELQRWRDSQNELQRIQEQQLAEAARREEERKAREEEERLARLQAEKEAAAQAEREALAAAAQTPEPEPEPAAPEPEPEPEPSPYETLLAQARNAADSGNLTDATSLYWQALAYEDDDARVWFELSRLQYRRGSHNDAELSALEALRREPARENFHLHYLNVIKETQPVRAYLRELERAQDTFPHNPEIALALANTYAQGHHSQADAIRYYRLFIQLAPRDSRRPEVEQTLRNLTQ